MARFRCLSVTSHISCIVARLLIPGPSLRTHVESFGKPRDLTSVLEALPGKLDIKRPYFISASDEVISVICGNKICIH